MTIILRKWPPREFQILWLKRQRINHRWKRRLFLKTSAFHVVLKIFLHGQSTHTTLRSISDVIKAVKPILKKPNLLIEPTILALWLRKVSWPSSNSTWVLITGKFLLEVWVPPRALIYHSLENYGKIWKLFSRLYLGINCANKNPYFKRILTYAWVFRSFLLC